MHAVRRLAMAQRIVIVVAIGLALLTALAWWYSGEVAPNGNWFAYAPNTETSTYFTVRRREAEHLIVPLLALLAWAGFSMWLLGPAPVDDHQGAGPAE